MTDKREKTVRHISGNDTAQILNIICEKCVLQDSVKGFYLFLEEDENDFFNDKTEFEVSIMVETQGENEEPIEEYFKFSTPLRFLDITLPEFTICGDLVIDYGIIKRAYLLEILLSSKTILTFRREGTAIHIHLQIQGYHGWGAFPLKGIKHLIVCDHLQSVVG